LNVFRAGWIEADREAVVTKGVVTEEQAREFFKM